MLTEIGLDHIPKLLIFNKTDLVNSLWAMAIASRFNGIACSAINSDTFGLLLKEIETRLWSEPQESGL